MARSVEPSVGNKPIPPLAPRGRDKGIGCPTRVFHPGPELFRSSTHRGRRYGCSLTACPHNAPSWATAAVPCRSSSGFQVGKHQRGDVEPHRRDSPATPPPAASSLPGGHATGVDSGHRPRAVTALALADIIRPPPHAPRALDRGVQIRREGGLRRISRRPTFGRGVQVAPLETTTPRRLGQREDRWEIRLTPPGRGVPRRRRRGLPSAGGRRGRRSSCC